MKVKLPTKKKKEEEAKPQKGFEEFNIDKDVLDELDNLEDDSANEETITVSDESIYQSNQENLSEEIEILDEKPKQQIVDAASSEFINIVRNNIDFCSREIKEVSATMSKIEEQKGTESFWKKSENIKTISKYVSKISDVQQKTLDLLVMFLGASGKMADDYDTILKTIDELGELNGGETEVLNYLLKIKKMIKEIKNNDERLKAIIFDNEQLKKKVDLLEKSYKEKTESYEKNSKIVVSKLQRLNTRLNRQSLSLLFSYIFIIIIGVIIYLKLFKGI